MAWTLLCSFLSGLLPGWTSECCSLPVRMHISQVWAYGETLGIVYAFESSDHVSQCRSLQIWGMCAPVWELGSWRPTASESTWTRKPWVAICLLFTSLSRSWLQELEHRRPALPLPAPSNSPALAPRALGVNASDKYWLCWRPFAFSNA